MEEQLAKLNELNKQVTEAVANPTAPSIEELKQAQEISAAIREYIKANDKVSLQKYLIHTRNELRRPNR
jgi:hypothetical protein